MRSFAWQHFGFLSEYAVYCYSSIIQFINCNKCTQHSKLAAARRSVFVVGGGVNFSAARRRGVAWISSENTVCKRNPFILYALVNFSQWRDSRTGLRCKLFSALATVRAMGEFRVCWSLFICRVLSRRSGFGGIYLGLRKVKAQRVTVVEFGMYNRSGGRCWLSWSQGRDECNALDECDSSRI